MSIYKIGPHGQKSSPGGLTWARRANIVKEMDGTSLLQAAPDHAIRIFRKYFQWQPFPANARQVADDILAGLGGYRHRNLYVEIYNEVGKDQRANYITLLLEIVPILHAAGVKVAGPSWATGDYEQEDWDAFRNAKRADGTPVPWCGLDLIALHAYWADRGFTEWNALRYRSYWQPGDPSIAITETANRDRVRDGDTRIDEGWVGQPGYRNNGVSEDQMLAEIVAYDAELMRDPFVVGGVGFTNGPYDDWQHFNLDPLADQLAALHKPLDLTKLMPAPKPEPPALPPILLRDGRDVRPMLQAAADTVSGVNRSLMLGCIDAESDLDARAERFGTRTAEAKAAIAAGDKAKLQAIIDDAGNDVSFGLAQRAVPWHWAGNRSLTADNVLAVREAVFADTQRDLIEMAKWLKSDLIAARNGDLSPVGGDVELGALIVYNNGSYPPSTDAYWTRNASRVTRYRTKLEAARVTYGLAPKPPAPPPTGLKTITIGGLEIYDVRERFPFVGGRTYPERDTATIRRFVQHHYGWLPSGMPTTIDGALKMLDEAHDYHTGTHKWAAIGYHLGIDSQGNIYYLNNLNLISNHARSANDDGIGVLWLGTFGETGGPLQPPEAMLAATRKLYRALETHLKRSLSLVGHYEAPTNATSCPGVNHWPTTKASILAVPKPPEPDYSYLGEGIREWLKANPDAGKPRVGKGMHGWDELGNEFLWLEPTPKYPSGPIVIARKAMKWRIGVLDFGKW